MSIKMTAILTVLLFSFSAWSFYSEHAETVACKEAGGVLVQAGFFSHACVRPLVVL